MHSRCRPGARLCALFAAALSCTPAPAQHGVIREYAALAPTADAVPLRPLFDAPLTDTSITVGPDKAFYLTGSAVEGQDAAFAGRIDIWRSPDMKQWTPLRTVELAGAKAGSPELRFLDGRFWLAFGREGGGTELDGREHTAIRRRVDDGADAVVVE